MSREQRMRVDAMVRGPIPTGQRPIEEMRAGFAALMAIMRVPEQVRSSPVTPAAAGRNVPGRVGHDHDIAGQVHRPSRAWWSQREHEKTGPKSIFHEPAFGVGSGRRYGIRRRRIGTTEVR